MAADGREQNERMSIQMHILNLLPYISNLLSYLISLTYPFNRDVSEI